MSVWWHGGGRIHGDIVLPPAETGVSRCLDVEGVESTEVGGVFITTERGLASSYAATTSDPWVYLVLPVGEILQDDLSGLPLGQSCFCERARILKRFRLSNVQVAEYRAAYKAMLRLVGEVS